MAALNNLLPYHVYTYTYAYGPGGVSGLLENRYAVACAIFASIGGLSFGYDQGVIANVLVMDDFLRRWPVGPWEKGLMTAVLELGALFGALSAGVMADRYSRRHSILFASVVFCIGSALQCGAGSLNNLILGRAIGGFGVGALSALSPLYLAEISPPELRGSLMALEQLAIVSGVVFGFWAGFATKGVQGSASWRIPLALQLIPGILLTLGSFLSITTGGSLLKSLPESDPLDHPASALHHSAPNRDIQPWTFALLPPSPRFLVMRGRNDEALRVLARLRMRGESDLLLELLEMKVTVALERHAISSNPINNNESIQATKNGSVMRKLFGQKYIRRTMIGIMVMFFQQWSGINALLYYGPTLVKNIGFGDSTTNSTLFIAGGIGIVQFLAVGPAIILIDRWGRKPLLRGGAAAMALSHLLIAVLIFQYEHDWAGHAWAAWVAVGAIYMFTFSYGTSFGPISWVIPAEVFPLAVRSRGVALATGSNWTNNFFIGLITPPLMEISAGHTFLLFACACALAYLWATHIIPETAGVSLEEMDRIFGDGTGHLGLLVLRMVLILIMLQLEREFGLHELITEAIDASES
ncbi:general substrate transporter [Hygrophoropsis aurantiaca]|uniref:General substrate transporter n=1 Tax=Hygrophoropsis aurantiaca TaxID=72124 RepID=A0ACB8ACV5_9AGAM|nr:general substrate transporter [Hygrophoropsis aurantiaca]